MIRLLPLCPAHLPWLSYKRPARQLHTILHNSWSARFTESDCAGFTESDYAGSWMAPFHSFLHWADSDSPWHSREAICDSPSWFRDLISVPTVSSPESIRKLETLFCCKCRPVWSEISTVKQQIALMSLPAYLYNEQQQREQNEWIDERPLLLHFILWPSTAVSKKEAPFTFSSYISDYSRSLSSQSWWRQLKQDWELPLLGLILSEAAQITPPSLGSSPSSSGPLGIPF